MKIIKVLVLMLGVLVFTLACGSSSGGGGGTTADNSQPQAVGLKTDTIRTIQQGDTWSYAVSANFSDPGGSESLSGTATTNILFTTKQSPVVLKDCLDQEIVMDLSGPGGTIVMTSHAYFLQDIAGSQFGYGHGDGTATGDVWVDSPIQGYYESLQSPMSVGQSSGTQSGTYTNGNTWTYEYSVTAIENISTGAGVYESYRVKSSAEINYTNGDKVVVIDTSWYVPGLGTVKMVVSEELSNSGLQQYLLTYTATLTGTNVSY